MKFELRLYQKISKKTLRYVKKITFPASRVRDIAPLVILLVEKHELQEKNGRLSPSLLEGVSQPINPEHYLQDKGAKNVQGK